MSGLLRLQLARLRRQQHGAAAQRHALIDMAVLPGNGQRIERALVIAGARLHVEQRVDAPGEARIALHRLLGESARRVGIVAARRFEEQAAHPEQLRLGTVEHRLEGAPCRVAVASELRRLRPQQRRQRLARQIAAGDAGIALRQRAVADADGEQPARQRVIALLPPPLAQMGGDRRGAREQIAQHRPEQDQQRHHGGDRQRADKGGCLDLIAEPIDRHAARPVGEPGEPDRRGDDTDGESEDAGH